MPVSEKLVVITNERVFSDGTSFFCDNIDIKTILEGLSNKFETIICCRFSRKMRPVKFSVNKIFIIDSLLKFIKSIYEVVSIKNKKIIYISIHPFSFSFFLLLSLFKKNSFVYLRSDGFKEYETILGKKWVWIYRFMFSIVTFSAKIISCHDSLAKGKKQKLLNPSELDQRWFSNLKNANLEIPKLLYVGRLKVEKGINSLVSIIKNIDSEVKLTIVGAGDNTLIEQSHIVKTFPFTNVKEELIRYYDTHNIVILPSFTEAHPKVVDEALSRLRPVIIFNEITHIIGNKKGIFTTNRDADSLKKLIFYVMNNYEDIQKTMKQNNLPIKEKFVIDLVKIVENKN